MPTNKVSVDFAVAGGRIRLQGAKYFYNDAGVRGKIGADLTDDADLSANVVIDKKVQYQRILVRLIAVMRSSSIGNVGSSAQSGKLRYFSFWCAPGKVGDAITGLPGTDVDANLLPGDWKIQKVMVPVDSNLA